MLPLPSAVKVPAMVRALPLASKPVASKANGPGRNERTGAVEAGRVRVSVGGGGGDGSSDDPAGRIGRNRGRRQIGEAGGTGGDHAAAAGRARRGGARGNELLADTLGVDVIGHRGIEHDVGGGSGDRGGDGVSDVDRNRAGADDGKRDGLEGSWS